MAWRKQPENLVWTIECDESPASCCHRKHGDHSRCLDSGQPCARWDMTAGLVTDLNPGMHESIAQDVPPQCVTSFLFLVLFCVPWGLIWSQVRASLVSVSWPTLSTFSTLQNKQTLFPGRLGFKKEAYKKNKNTNNNHQTFRSCSQLQISFS